MKKIEFYPTDQFVYDTVEMPKPAKNYIPKWYAEKQIFDGGSPIYSNGEITNKGLKSCMPFFDAMNYGYIQETWCDINIQYDEINGVTFNYSRGPEIIKLRGPIRINASEEFHQLDFVWSCHWIPKLPQGYSALFTHPMNRLDLPFYSTSGVIDSDNFYHVPGGNYPFLLKRGFEGTIPKGTPMFQIIPVKRDNWESHKMEFNFSETRKRISLVESYFMGSYKRFFHVKKSFK